MAEQDGSCDDRAGGCARASRAAPDLLRELRLASSVHAHWLLARLYRRLPDGPEASTIRALLDSQFTAEKVAGEVAYLARPSSRGFERPYGWAWALMLSSELARHRSEQGKHWFRTLRPFAAA